MTHWNVDVLTKLSSLQEFFIKVAFPFPWYFGVFFVERVYNQQTKGRHRPMKLVQLPSIDIVALCRAIKRQSIAERGPQIAKFLGPTWGPPGSCRPQMGPHVGPRNLAIRVGTSASCGSLCYQRVQLLTAVTLYVDVPCGTWACFNSCWSLKQSVQKIMEWNNSLKER